MWPIISSVICSLLFSIIAAALNCAASPSMELNKTFEFPNLPSYYDLSHAIQGREGSELPEILKLYMELRSTIGLYHSEKESYDTKFEDSDIVIKNGFCIFVLLLLSIRPIIQENVSYFQCVVPTAIFLVIYFASKKFILHFMVEVLHLPIWREDNQKCSPPLEFNLNGELSETLDFMQKEQNRCGHIIVNRYLEMKRQMKYVRAANTIRVIVPVVLLFIMRL